MKKYNMLIITIIMIILTTSVYIYNQLNNEIPQFIYPSFNLDSPKFEEIKETELIMGGAAYHN